MNRVSIHALSCSALNAQRLADRLGIPFHEIMQHDFPDGEMRVTVGPPTATTIIYASLDKPNDKLIALLLAAEALKRGGCKRIILLAPYLCYMRQDTAFHAGEAISQKAIGQFLATFANRIITVDAHLHRAATIAMVFPGIEAENISAIPAIAESLRLSNVDPKTVVIGPDAESGPWVSDLAGRLGLLHTVAQKNRQDDRSVAITFPERALIKGRPALIVDDIVSSGGTLVTCAKALLDSGATIIDAVIVHALFPAEMVTQFKRAGIRSIVSTQSVPHPTNSILLDDVFAKALHEEINALPCPETIA